MQLEPAVTAELVVQVISIQNVTEPVADIEQPVPLVALTQPLDYPVRASHALELFLDVGGRAPEELRQECRAELLPVDAGHVEPAPCRRWQALEMAVNHRRDALRRTQVEPLGG